MFMHLIALNKLGLLFATICCPTRFDVSLQQKPCPSQLIKKKYIS